MNSRLKAFLGFAALVYGLMFASLLLAKLVGWIDPPHTPTTPAKCP